MHNDYKMTQTELTEFTIHDRRTGEHRATITREPHGAWSTHPEAQGGAEGDPAAFDEQPRAQAAFDAFIEREADPDESE
jgi:hypothetical protein